MINKTFLPIIILLGINLNFPKTVYGLVREINILNTVTTVEPTTLNNYVTLDFIDPNTKQSIKLITFNQSNKEIIIEYQNNDLELVYSANFYNYIAQIANYLKKFNTFIQNNNEINFSIPVKSKNDTSLLIIRII